MPVCTASMSQAASTFSSVTAAVGTAAGSGRQRLFTAKRALEILQNLTDADSGSDEESQRNEDSDSSVQLSPTSSDDDDDDAARQSDAASTTSSVQQTPATTAADEQTVARDGTKWTIVTQTPFTGRIQSQNVFTAKPGPTAYFRTVTSPVNAFKLLINEKMLRIKEDKLCMMSWILSRFVENCQKAFISLTVDEQLFRTKARCRFTQFMPNKPDKFGIKFWILAELNSKYCLNLKPYLCKDG